MKYKDGCCVLLINVLLLIVVLDYGHTAENTFEINIDKKPGKIDTYTAIDIIDKYEQLYIGEIQRPFKEDDNRNQLNENDFTGIMPNRYKRLEILLKIEDLKGQIMGPLYSGQIQGVRKLLYVLILTDDWIRDGNTFNKMRHEIITLTSDNIIKLSKINAGINEKVYISDDTTNMLKDIVTELNTVNSRYTKRQL